MSSNSISSYVSPAEVGVMSGVIGAGIGYTLAHRKYNLEQLLTQEPDIFEKTIPTKVVAHADTSQKTAHELISHARKIILDAKDKRDAKIAEFLQDAKYEKAYKGIKKLLPKARVQSAIVLGVISGFIGMVSKIAFGND